MNSLARETSAPEALAPPRSWADRLLAAFPLTLTYIGLCMVYLVEAWRHVTPWLFGDELETTQLARAIAATGHAARRGVAHTPDSIYPYLLAPAWKIHDVAAAYSLIKDLNVFAMAAVVFPTYWLARLVVPRRYALFAAAGAAAIPSLAYSAFVVQETVAYPFAALCFFLIAKALVEYDASPRWKRWAVAAVLASCIAPAVRLELVVVPAVLVGAALFAVWSSDWARERRRSWSWSDWAAAVVLLLGAIFLISGWASHQSIEFLGITRYYKHRILVLGDWAAGALMIGVGALPLVAGLAALVPARGEERIRPVRMFRCVAVAGIVAFGLYTAMKAAYLSTTFATRIEERNLIYVTPLLFVGTALVLERRRVNPFALAAAGAYALYLAIGTPLRMDIQLYSDALGLAIFQQANRYLYWTPTTARAVLIAVVVAGAVALGAAALLRGRARLATGLVAALAVGTVAWTLTAQVAAAVGSNSLADQAEATLRRPVSWVDDAVASQPVLYVGSGESDPNPENLLEFWNRSIVRVTSLDGSVDGPGPSGGPDLTIDGRTLFDVTPERPRGLQFAYAVQDAPCVDYAGSYVVDHLFRAGGRLRTWQLVRLDTPNRLRSMCTGISPDGWTGPDDTSYFRFGDGRGWLQVVVSRANWGGPTPPSPVQVQLGSLRINANNQPVLAPPAATCETTIGSTQTKTLWLRTTTRRFAVHVVVEKKFVPHEFLPADSDQRTLGAQVSYRFFASRPPQARACSG